MRSTKEEIRVRWNADGLKGTLIFDVFDTIDALEADIAAAYERAKRDAAALMDDENRDWHAKDYRRTILALQDKEGK
jgi:hypothetical protein